MSLRLGSRRALLLAAAAWPALVWSGAAFAQSKQKPVLIGFLHFSPREASLFGLTAFKEGLAALGYKEGQDFVVEERWADGRRERLLLLAEELAAKRPEVIVAAPNPAVRAAATAAPATPIVQASGGDPVLAGFAKSHARPGGMITGSSNFATDITEKYVEYLLALAPKLRRLGILTGPERGAPARTIREAALRATVHHSVEVYLEEASGPVDIEPAISRLAKQGVQALMVLANALTTAERPRIIKRALAQRWPMIGSSGVWAEHGAALGYGPDPSANFRRAAYFVDRILKGAKPADLPIEQPTKLELAINVKTAKMLGLTISQELLLRADRVIV